MAARRKSGAAPVGGGGARNARSLANLRQGGPPAPGGNDRARTHGAYGQIARDALEAKAREIFDALAQDAPVRAADGGLPREDSVVVRLLADVLCRLDGVGEFLARRGWEDDDGQPRSAVDVEIRLRNQALSLAVECGMTPKSRAALGLDLVRAQSLDLAQHWADEGDVDG